MKTSSSYYTISNSVFSILIFVVAFLFFSRYVLTIKDKRLWLVSFVLGSVFSFTMVCGRNVYLYDTTQLKSLSTWICILGGIPFLLGIVMYVLENVDKVKKICRIQGFDRWMNEHMSSKKMFFVSWVILFLTWFVGLIASYPGMYGYDSVFQLNFYIDGEIDLWHPLAHTYLMGFCIETIGGLLGSREAGLFVYSVIQMLFISAIFALVCYYIAKKKCPAIIQVLVLVTMACLPVYAIMSFSCTKDVPFAGFLCIMTYIMMRMSEDEKYLCGWKRWSALIGSILGMIMFRNQGIYVVVIAFVAGFVLLRKQWKRLLILLLVTVVMYSTYSGPVTKLLHGVEASRGIEETLSVPIMQISRAYCYNNDELTSEEKALVDLYIPRAKNYDVKKHGISDHYKETFNSERFKDKPLEFISLWAKIGLKAPLSYVDAFARLSIGLWYPDMNYRDPDAYHPYWEYENTIQKQPEWIILERSTPECLQWLADFYYDMSYNNSYQQIPVLSMLYSSGLYAWLMFLYVGWCIYKKQYKLLFPATVLVLYWLTLLLGPVVLYRYMYPVIVSIPILLAKMISVDDVYNSIEVKK